MGGKDAPRIRKKAQDLLDKTLSGAVVISSRTGLDGFVRLERTAGLFPLLTRHFVYVDAFRDAPEGPARPASYRPFTWGSYGQFLEWFNERTPQLRWGWEHCDPYLVFGKACVLSDRPQESGIISTPALRLDRYFSIAPHVKDEKVAISFEMGEYGWPSLRMTPGDRFVGIDLSGVFSPFRTMIEWLKMVDRGDIPAVFEIDEEGTIKILSAFNTNDSERILLLVTDQYEDQQLFLDGIVGRQDFVGSFKIALRRFLEEKFDPEHWRDDDDPPASQGGCLGRSLVYRFRIALKIEARGPPKSDAVTSLSSLV